MSNITSAKSSLRAELAHVQSGLAYYKARVEALSAAIDQLDSIGDESQVDMERSEGSHMQKMRRARKARQASASPGAAAKAPKAARQGKAGSRLPATGGDFFPALISEQKQSMSELLQAAAMQLPFKATTEELTQLRSRLVAAVNHMLQAGKIRDQGKGRQRVYFKP